MYTFSKDERLKGKLAFQKVMSDGNTYMKFPYKFYWSIIKTDQKYPIQIGISIPKKNIPKANKRNLIRRRIKEVYRIHKHQFYNLLENKNIKIRLVILYLNPGIATYNEVNITLPMFINNMIHEICKKSNN